VKGGPATELILLIKAGMNAWSFHSAGSLHFGRGALAALPRHARRLLNERVLIISDQTLKSAGIVDQIRSHLPGNTVHEFIDIVPEPPSDVIEAATMFAREVKPDLIIGVGGGSNMDAAKLVALLHACGGTLSEYVGDCRVPNLITDLICIPTTAGTGSEVSAAAVYTDSANAIKVSCLSPFLRPMAAIVDPSLTDKCPPKVTADSGIDALTHAIEAFTAVDHADFITRPPGTETVYQGKNAMADAMARECIGLVAKHLRTAVHEPTNTAARDGMALAATLGGLAFSNAGVALVHAMEYPVGGAVHVSHGAGNGLLLPFVMKFNAEVRGEAIAEIGTLLGTDRDTHAAIAAVENLKADIGIPKRLREIGVTREQLPGFADKAFAIKRLMRVNPRMPSRDEILSIYEAAY
jgi:alcohol dehydrogenase class IV